MGIVVSAEGKLLWFAAELVTELPLVAAIREGEPANELLPSCWAALVCEGPGKFTDAVAPAYFPLLLLSWIPIC